MATEIITLQDIPIATVTEAFNDAFSDYFIEVDMSPEEMAFKITAEDIDLSISPAVLENGKIMGLILHGNRELGGMRTAYNAGTGVRPEARRRGMVKRMFEFVLPLLRERKFHQTLLEVIDINQPAIQAYLGIGFRETRYLESFVGRPHTVETPASITICKLRNMDELSGVEAWWDYEPTWQHQWETAMHTWDRQTALGVFEGEQLVGYGLFSHFSGRVLQFAIHPLHRRKGLGKVLFSAMQEYSSANLRLVNVEQITAGPSDFLYRLGFKKMLGQWEMHLPLT